MAKADVADARKSGPEDRFGNPVDPVLGFARGTILGSSIDEAKRLRRGQAVAAERVRRLGAETIGVFTGNQRDFPVMPEDLKAYCEEWVGPGLFAEDLRRVALAHLGGRADDEMAVFNRTSAGIIATVAALADGRPVVSVVPPGGRSHASVSRGCRIAGVPMIEARADADWPAAIRQNAPKLVVVTTVTSSLERLDDAVAREVAAQARAVGATVFLDEAYGARLRPVLHGGALALALGGDLAITNCDKAGLSGPRAGVIAGRAPLVIAAAAKGAEFGMEARAPIAVGVLRSLEGFRPDHLRAEAAAGQELAAALERRLGKVVSRSDLGPMVHEDDLLDLVLARATGANAFRPVPAEAAAAIGMVLLRDHGILTVNTHGQPGARVSLRLKPTLDALSRTGGVEAVADAVMAAIDTVAAIVDDEASLRDLIIGSRP